MRGATYFCCAAASADTTRVEAIGKTSQTILHRRRRETDRMHFSSTAGRTDRCAGNSKPGTRPLVTNSIRRVTQPRVAAHHNSDLRNVKCKLWCKCRRERPARAGIAMVRRRDSRAGFHSGQNNRRSRWILRQGQKASARIEITKKSPQIRSAPNSRELWDARTALPQVCSRKRYGPPARVYIPLSCQSPGTNRPCRMSRSQSRICSALLSPDGRAGSQALDSGEERTRSLRTSRRSGIEEHS